MKINGQTVKKGYKVVRTSNLSSISSIGSVIKYKINKWARPRRGCGPLAVFTNLKDAKSFASPWPNTRCIYECWYVPSKQMVQWNAGREVLKSEYMPKGKALADAVCLIRKLNEWI